MIYLIITSSIIDKNQHTRKDDEFRKNTYLNSIKQTLSLLPKSITPILVENNGKRETYLDNVGVPIFYTDNNNNPLYYHKALNEMADIHTVIEKYNIKDEDMIIKITGRYYPYHSYFFDLICNEKFNYDVFIKFFNVATMEFESNDCVMGLFAMRCKYLKSFHFLQELNEKNPSAEVQFCKYIKSLDCKVYNVDYLYATFCFADDLLITDL
jgi:hypothetical protein